MPYNRTGPVSLHYNVVGAGEPVVLIHGLGANMAFWYLGAAPMLARAYQVVVYDLRGHGRSGMPDRGYTLEAMATDLQHLLDHLGLAAVHLVGHSYGARVALCFAGRHPQRVRSLTVADTQLRALQPPMRLREWPQWPAWRAHLLKDGVRELPDDDAWIDFRLLSRLHRHVAGVRGLGRRAGRPRYDDQSRWSALMRTHAADELADETPLDARFVAGIQAPALLLYGRLSHCVPTSTYLLACMPWANRILVPKAGHFVPSVKPKLFARLVRRHFDAHVLTLPGAAKAPPARPRRAL